jgi:hypothetical protein
MDSLVGVLFTVTLAIAIGYLTIKGFRKEVDNIKHGCCSSASSGCSGKCSSGCSCGLNEEIDNR